MNNKIEDLIGRLDPNKRQCIICKKYKELNDFYNFLKRSSFCVECLTTKDKLTKHLSKGIR